MHKGRKIDYQKKNLKNPFFNRKNKRIKLPSTHFAVRGKIIVVFLTIIFIFLLWLVFFSSVFKIKEISSSGLSRIPSAEVNDFALNAINRKKMLIFSQSNMLFMSKRDLEKKINEKYSFAKLDIKKKWPHKIDIAIQEKSYSYIWYEADKYFYADIDGYIAAETNPLNIKENKYPIIQNNGEAKIADNKINLNSDTLNYILEIFKNLPCSRLNTTIDRFMVDNNSNAVIVKLLSGPDLFFNTKEGMDKQFEKLITIKEDKLKEDFKNKSYIDLRFGDRVYYR